MPRTKIIKIIVMAQALFILSCFAGGRTQNSNNRPVRIALAGLTHDHAHLFFRRQNEGDIKLVGIYEPNKEVAKRYAKSYGINQNLFYTEFKEMLDAVKPEAVSAFGSIYQHLGVVQECAPRGIHVMVEKPLGVSVEHALQMQALAEKYHIHLLTNYETSWYASTQAAYRMIHSEQQIGTVRKIVIHDGHRGPKEIGVSNEFLAWLTDPVQNGGGALIDFGCYGANLITWLMKGSQPLTVTAVTQQIKPDIYPKVDDEATIIVTYPGAQGIIQASWNWPFNRKDMQIYGTTGYIFADDGQHMRLRQDERKPEQEQFLKLPSAPMNDPFCYLAAVVRGDLTVQKTDLASLENNVLVVRILEAARESAKKGKTIYLQDR